jgi:predicted transcriptional regulator
MKTAISIPEETFRNAEALARHLSISRSQLYSRAITEYVSRHAPDRVTEALDRVYGEIDEETDRFVTEASRRILEQTEW